MRPRFPIGLLIIIVLLTITGFIALMNEWDLSFFTNPLYWAVMIVATFLMLIYNGIGTLIESDKYKALSADEQKAFLEAKETPFYQRLYDSAFGKQNEEEVGDIMMDHDYDGIHELDNKLPQWWLALFYFGVFFLFFYMFAYSFTDFAHQDVELENFNARHDKEVEEYLATVPQKTPEEMVFSTENFEAGKKIFNDNCVTCHNVDGGAANNSGANLTDDYWRNINSEELFHNIVNVVWKGSAYDKTMRAFGERGEILGNDVEKLAAYVTMLNQETDAADGKAPLGLVVKQWAKDPLPSDPSKIVDVVQYVQNAEGGDSQSEATTMDASSTEEVSEVAPKVDSTAVPTP